MKINRLFLKILVAFWLAMLLIVTGIAFLNAWVQQQSNVEADLAAQMSELAETIAVGEPIPPFTDRPGIWVVKANGLPINDQPSLPRGLVRRIRQARSEGHRHGRRHDVLWQSVRNPDGELFRLIAVNPVATGGALQRGEAGSRARFLLTMLASGITSALLAWILTRRIQRIRRATVAIADGTLATRVNDSTRDELGDLARDFDRMAARLESSRRTADLLLRDISHELRSPLARLQVAMELAREGAGGDLEPEFARMELEADRLNGLIAEVLALSRHRNNELTLQTEPVDLNALLKTVVADASFECQQRELNVVSELSNDQLVIEADPLLIQRVLDNVVRNAIAYSPTNSTVTVGSAHHGDRISMTISDQGPGIPAEDLDRVLEPFVQLDPSRSRQGSGVGLAIANDIVIAHGGTIRLSSAPESGLTVSIQLPVELQK